jgi:glycosyltransferase involved in cell wall biosynthesis
MSFPDFSKWAVVAHKDDSGFGRQADDARRVLGFGHHLAIPSERLVDKPLEGPTERRLDTNAPDADVERLLEGIEGVLFFERPQWHPRLLAVCRKLGVKSVCVPNWEWFNGDNPVWELCDLLLCTSQFALRVVESYGWKNARYVGPWPLNLASYPKRTISGPAKTFFHNAGIVDKNDRKGTGEAIQAFCRVKRDDLRMIVRMQKEAELPAHDSRVEVRVGNLVDHADLYRAGEVAVQPSKMEGNGFMVLEPMVCGIPTVTTNYPPMNEYVVEPEMLAGLRWFKRKAFPTQWVKHAHLRLPRVGDLAQRIEWCAENDLNAISERNRRWAEEMFEPRRVREIWATTIAKELKG